MSDPNGHPPLKGATLNQIGIVVRDAEQAARSLATVLGIPVPEVILTDSEEKARTVFRGRSTPARAKLAFFPLGPISIEFIEPVGGPSTWSDHLERHGSGLHHIAFQVEDTEAASAALVSAGAHLEQKGDFPGGRYAYLDATDRIGAVIELLQNFKPGG